MGVDFTPAHAAALVSQLPSNARVFRAEEPNAAWDEQLQLLYSIDYSLRFIAWTKTKDAKHNRNAPKPPKTPEERLQARQRAAAADLSLVRSVLGEGVTDAR